MKMTLMGHFRELKRRVVWSLLFFCSAFVAGLYMAPVLQDFIVRPLIGVLPDPAMIYTGIADAFALQFSMAGLFAMLVSIPFVLWHAWAYVSPGLKNGEKKIAVPILILSPMLFISGAAFAYFILFPIIFKFFVEIGGPDISMLPNAVDYLSFSIGMLKAFGFAFQFPLILVLLNRSGLASRKQILSAARYIIVGVFVISAILTPPDIISQIALAAPLIVLFGLSFLFMI